MPAKTRIPSRLRFVFAQALVFIAVVSQLTEAQPPDSTKKVPESKSVPGGLPVIKLPDGTYLWTGTPTDGSGERVTLTLQEIQKLQDQIDQLKKKLDAKEKPSAPSECVIRGRIEKQGDQLVAVLKMTYSFRTALPHSVVTLGGRKGFLAAAALDGNKLAILDATEDGFAALVENAGDHTLNLELLATIAPRGITAKTEIGFRHWPASCTDHASHVGAAKPGSEACEPDNPHAGFLATQSSFRSAYSRYQTTRGQIGTG